MESSSRINKEINPKKRKFIAKLSFYTFKLTFWRKFPPSYSIDDSKTKKYLFNTNEQ